MNYNKLLEKLAEEEGLDSHDLSIEIMEESNSMGVCSSEGCGYTTEVEPDCRDGYCEECDTNTVISGTEIVINTII